MKRGAFVLKVCTGFADIQLNLEQDGAIIQMLAAIHLTQNEFDRNL